MEVTMIRKYGTTYYVTINNSEWAVTQDDVATARGSGRWDASDIESVDDDEMAVAIASSWSEDAYQASLEARG